MGYHIGLLIMAAIYYLAPQFIKEGRLCWLRAPLYIIGEGAKEQYYFTDQELEVAKKKNKIKGHINRNKGLGEMDPDSVERSMFNPEFQRMDVMEYSEEAIDKLVALMGEDVQPRKEFVFNKIDFSEVKE